VFIFSSPLLKRITRGLIAWIVVLILLAPVIIINAVSKVAVRVGVIVIASAVVIMMLALMTKIRTWEIFLGGATYVILSLVLLGGCLVLNLERLGDETDCCILRYATVLVVFVPGSTGVM